MKTRSVVHAAVAGLALALAALPVAMAQDKPAESPAQSPSDARPPQGPGGRGQGRGPGANAGAPANIEAAMKAMGRQLRGLKDTIGDAAKKDQNLAAINAMQAACVAAKGMALPGSVKKDVTDPAERKKLADEYRADLMKVLQTLMDLEKAVWDGDSAKATATLAKVAEMRDAGHAAMGMKD